MVDARSCKTDSLQRCDNCLLVPNHPVATSAVKLRVLQYCSSRFTSAPTSLYIVLPTVLVQEYCLEYQYRNPTTVVEVHGVMRTCSQQTSKRSVHLDSVPCTCTVVPVPDDSVFIPELDRIVQVAQYSIFNPVMNNGYITSSNCIECDNVLNRYSIHSTC